MIMWGPFPSLERRRARLLRTAPAGPLRDYLAVPFPSPRTECRAVRFTALDVETTGLDPGQDEIVSIGWVCLQDARIDLSTAGHLLVKPTRAMPEASAALHHITDDMAAHGLSLRAALDRVLPVLAGSILVAHNAAVDAAFLAAGCARAYGGPFLAPAVDTLELACRARWREAAWRSGEGVTGSISPCRDGLRLQPLRRAHGLPDYPAHDALTDALAVAELFLALLARMGEGRVPLHRVLAPA